MLRGPTTFFFFWRQMQTCRNCQTRWEFSNSLGNWVCYNWSNLGLSCYHTKNILSPDGTELTGPLCTFLYKPWCCDVQSRCMILSYLQVVWSIAWNIPHWAELEEAITNNRVPLDLLSIYVCRCISIYVYVCSRTLIFHPCLSSLPDLQWANLFKPRVCSINFYEVIMIRLCALSILFMPSIVFLDVLEFSMCI